MDRSKVLVLVASNFNGHELFVTLHHLLEAEFETTVIALEAIIEDELTLERIRVHCTVDEFDMATLPEYDAFIASSGAPKWCKQHQDHPKVLQIVDWFVEHDKVLSAYCLSVPVIRVALRGKRTACFPLNAVVDVLRRSGAILTGRSLESDGNVVTAETQMSTQNSIQEVIRLLRRKSDEPHSGADG